MPIRSRRVAALMAAAALLPTVPALAFTPVDQMKDVRRDHWAYGAIKTLVEKYHVMDGFPDGTFKGQHMVNRYELAAILAKTIAKINEMLAAATGVSPEASGSSTISPEDLATLSRLEQEFRDELALIKERQDAIDARLTAEEHRPKVTVGLQGFVRGYTASGGTSQPADYRVMTDLGLDATVSSAVTYTGLLSIYGSGVHALANGHEAVTGAVPAGVGDLATPVYVRRSYLSVQPGRWYVHAGMLNFGETMAVGSTLHTAFAGPHPLWNEGQSGYGFVGTPAVASGSIARYPVGGPVPEWAGRAPWNAGLDPAQDLLDPNSDPSNSGSAPAVVAGATFGRAEVALGANFGVPGANPAVQLAGTPAAFPLIAGPGQGYYLAKAAVDLGPARASAYYHADTTSQLIGSNPTGKGAGLVLDLGSDALGVSLSYSEITRSMVGAPAGTADGGYFQEGGFLVAGNNLLGTGADLGIGTKFGFLPDGSPFATDPLSGLLNQNWTSTGGYLRMPGVAIVQSVTLAAQTSGTNFFGNNFGAGLTLIAQLRLAPQLPDLQVQYDQGRFGANNGLTATGILPTHEQWTVGTSTQF